MAVQCRDCKGRGKVSCSNCLGRGWNLPSGTGLLQSIGEKIQGNPNRATCDKCEGKRILECERCCGSGWESLF